jgi:hypothetical protein
MHWSVGVMPSWAIAYHGKSFFSSLKLIEQPFYNKYTFVLKAKKQC